MHWIKHPPGEQSLYLECLRLCQDVGEIWIIAKDIMKINYKNHRFCLHAKFVSTNKSREIKLKYPCEEKVYHVMKKLTQSIMYDCWYGAEHDFSHTIYSNHEQNRFNNTFFSFLESSILLLFTDQRTFLQDFNHHQDTSLTLKTELHEHLYYTRAINPWNYFDFTPDYK